MRALILLLSLTPLLPAAKTLDVYFIDVEGGQATLIVTPSKQSVLIDAGWPGNNYRDANRIVAAAKAAGVKRIDWLLVTHYHTDHIGGVPQLAEKMPVVTFVDHGPNNETGKSAAQLSEAYAKALEKGQHLVVKVGDTIPVKGLDVKVIASNGDIIQGGGEANPLCGSEKPRDPDKTENARSVGMLMTFGKFRIVDLADLTWNKELELACPTNRAGTVDLYVVTHHGMNLSGSATIVHAMKPRVAIMNNGARKGGSPDAWQIVRKSPGLEDLWQLHFAVAGGKDNNSPDPFIANPDEQCEGKWIKLSAEPSGTFTVTNSRNKYSKTYQAR